MISSIKNKSKSLRTKAIQYLLPNSLSSNSQQTKEQVEKRQNDGTNHVLLPTNGTAIRDAEAPATGMQVGMCAYVCLKEATGRLHLPVHKTCKWQLSCAKQCAGHRAHRDEQGVLTQSTSTEELPSVICAKGYQPQFKMLIWSITSLFYRTHLLTRANLQVITKKKRKRGEGEGEREGMPGLVNKSSPSSIMITVLEWASWATLAKG